MSTSLVKSQSQGHRMTLGKHGKNGHWDENVLQCPQPRMSLETGQGPSHPRGWCGWVNLDSGSFLGFPVSEFWAVLTLQLPPSFQGQVFGNWLDFNSINVTSTLPGHFTKILDIFKVPYSQTIPLDRTHLFDSLAWRTVEKGKNLGLKWPVF